MKAGITRIQFIIIVAIVVIIAIIAVPRVIKVSRLSKAVYRALAIADGFKQYYKDTGQECTRIEDLLTDPGVSGWMGPYVNKGMDRNPWGGRYTIDPTGRRIVIPKGDEAPDQYELGGSEEISFEIKQ